jgi:hypothetical protein
MGNMPYRPRRRATALLPSLALLTLLAVTPAACGDKDAPEIGGAVPTTVALCAVERHVVVFDYFGGITTHDDDLFTWMENPATAPPARSGVADVAQAYRQRGYEILYVTTAPPNLAIGGVGVGDLITEWLTAQGFPMDEGTTLWMWDGNQTPMRSISSELTRLVDEGASIDAAYTDNEDKAFAFKSAVPSQRVFTLGSGATATGTTPVPDDDMVAHLAEIELLEQVCRAG